MASLVKCDVDSVKGMLNFQDEQDPVLLNWAFGRMETTILYNSLNSTVMKIFCDRSIFLSYLGFRHHWSGSSQLSLIGVGLRTPSILAALRDQLGLNDDECV